MHLCTYRRLAVHCYNIFNSDDKYIYIYMLYIIDYILVSKTHCMFLMYDLDVPCQCHEGLFSGSSQYHTEFIHEERLFTDGQQYS